MAETGDSAQQKSRSDLDREKALNELKAMREKRLQGSSGQGAPATTPQSKPPEAKPQQGDSVDLSKARAEDDDAAIAAVRASRMQAEAYHDIARLRKQAHAHEHKASKFNTKSKSFEAKAQNAITKAVTARTKATNCREKSKDVEVNLRDLEKDLKSSASGDSSMPPEKIRLKMAKIEKKMAQLNQKGMKLEARAAGLNEKAALFKTKAAFNLEQSKIHEAEVRNFTKRADNLEKAGQ